ncbi:hypothetical protein [Pseudomonas sp. CGJS7]|uniref:hypothetical protein n=1 Tax=Pseudomonas sp. CGJS7 TaxID=3109348 RepID=UPI00300A9D01
MVMMIDDRTPYIPPPPPPPPPPTPPELKKADPAQANASIKQMTPEQQTQLKADVEAMSVSDRTDFANDLATKLDAPQLLKIESVFGKDALADAVETRSPATVREEYANLSAGKPADGAEPVSSVPVDKQVSQAQQDYKDRVQSTGITSTYQLTELAKAHPNDQAYLGELARLAKDGGELQAAASTMPGGLFQKDASGAYSWTNENQGDARRDAFAGLVHAGLERGTLKEADIRNDAATNPVWVDVAQRIGLPQVGPTDASRQVAGKVDELSGAQKSAKEDAAKLDKELGGLLAEAGPLTPQQQAKFVEAYRNDPEHKPTYDKAIETSQALNDYLANNRDAVLDASVRDPEVAQQTHDSIVALAESGHGITALTYLAEVQRVPDSALGVAFAKFGDLNGDVLTNASSSAMAELLAKNDGSVSAAQAQFTNLMDAIGKGVPAWGGYKDFSEGQKVLDAFASGDFKAIDYYSKLYNDASPAMRAFAGAGVVLGAVSATAAGKEGDYVNAIKGYAQAGENGARLVAGALNGLADSGRLAQYAGTFTGAAGFAAKLAPALGLIANTASLVHSFGEAKDGNVGYGIALFGDVIGVLGSAMECFPPTAIPGAIVAGIGAIVSGIGGFIGELINGGERRDEIRGLLKDAGVDPAIIDNMVSSGSKLVEMTKDLNMTPEQVQSLIKSQPGIAFSPGHAQSFVDAAKACGLSGAEVQTFAEKMAQDRPDYNWDLFNQRSNANPSPEQQAQHLRSIVENLYPNAAAYAKQQSPELFGKSAQERDAAVRDYQREGFTSTWQMSLGNQLKNHGDPAYRAEMIGRMQQDGRLKDFTQFISGYGDLWSGDAKAAIGDAVKAGRITQDQANEALKYLP